MANRPKRDKSSKNTEAPLEELFSNQIRAVERDILDRAHEQHAIFSIPEDIAIAGLLHVAGRVFHHFRQLERDPSQQFDFTFSSTTFSQSLSHCLRWVRDCCPTNNQAYSPNRNSEHEHVGAALEWAKTYTHLVTDHVAWSNGLIDATCDSANKTITFNPPHGTDLRLLRRQLVADRRYWWNVMYYDFPRDGFAGLMDTYKKTHHPEPAYFRFHNLTSLKEFPQLEEWVRAKVFPELDDQFSVGLYCMGKLRRFFSVLYTICAILCLVADEIEDDSQNPAGETPILRAPWNNGITWLCEVTGIGREAVEAIVNDLSLNTARFHCSISTTPFVVSRSRTLFLQPNTFMHLDLQRAFANAITCGTATKVFDRISTITEQHHLKELANLLRQRGMKVLCNRTFSFSKTFTPDLIVSDKRTHTILVIEFKNILSASGPAAVTKRIQEIKKGTDQLQGYVQLFTDHPDQLQQLLRDRLPYQPPVVNIIGLLLLRSPMPLPIPISSVVIDDEVSFRERLTNLREMGQAITVHDLLPRDDPSDGSSELRFIFQEVQVRDWVYRRSVVLAPGGL